MRQRRLPRLNQNRPSQARLIHAHKPRPTPSPLDFLLGLKRCLPPMQARNPTQRNLQRKTPPIAEDATAETAVMQAVTQAVMVAMAKVAVLVTKEELRDDPKAAQMVALKVVTPAAGAVGVVVKVANAKTPTNVNALTQTEKP